MPGQWRAAGWAAHDAAAPRLRADEPGGYSAMRGPQPQGPAKVVTKMIVCMTLKTRWAMHGGLLGGPRMTPPRPACGPMSPGGYSAMRGPQPQGPGMPPMGMGPRGAWPGGAAAGGGSAPLNYSGGSPGAYGAPPGSNGPPGPPTPIMPSPQDSSNSGGDNMYTLMKPVGGGALGGEFPLAGEHAPPHTMPQPPPSEGLGGVDGMKSSPGGVGGGGPGTPREDSGSGMGDYNLSFGGPGGDQNDQTESAAILKIKESMQEEAKRFEKDPDHPDYFMQ
ncbi:single-stranded DNA binding protein, SSDP domain-containing protein [Phthorimaea operculella]|nr:single-stranded DNA binding protein, SSDP domain-containing protein [Phthorimaea operculella]